jgi:signal transduction histidine kinase/CheY-like chemotaxis protein
VAAALGPALLRWAEVHDPDELLAWPDPGGSGTFWITFRPLGIGAEHGIIAAGFRDGNQPTANHHLLLNVAATQAATAVQNVRLLRSLRRYTTQLSGLAEATNAILDPAHSMEDAVRVLTERARALVGAHRAATRVVVDESPRRVVEATSCSEPAAGRPTFAVEPHGASPPAAARTELAAPLIGRDGAARGMIQLCDKYEGEFNEQDEAILVQLASVAALSIEQRCAVREAEAARAEAETASRTKDEFLAMLGHELRNPLAPIHTALQLMRLRPDSTAERERTVIERQVKHLTRLVDDLLDVSRIARGRVELKRARVNLAEVVARAIEMASPLIELRRLDMQVHVPHDGLDIDGDALRLAQAVSNLLSNAAKYTEPGGLITIAAERTADDVVLTVRDTGIGIAPELLPRIFDLFVQGGQNLDRSQGGLGLGLGIVRGLIGMHGGTVSAHSDGLGRGSEFVIRLPGSTAPGSEAGDPPPAGPVHASAADGAGDCRVLVVDDNEDAAEMMRTALTVRGYQVRVAHDGPGALRTAIGFQPHVALLDIGLPVMDGYELAGRLRQLPGLDRLYLIAVTGYGQDADRRRSRAAGFDRHLVKPLDLEVLEGALRDALERARPA